MDDCFSTNHRQRLGGNRELIGQYSVLCRIFRGLSPPLCKENSRERTPKSSVVASDNGYKTAARRQIAVFLSARCFRIDLPNALVRLLLHQKRVQCEVNLTNVYILQSGHP